MMFAVRGQTNSLGGLTMYALQAGLGLCSSCVSIGDDTMLALQPLHVLNLPHRVGMTCMCRPRKLLGPRLACDASPHPHCMLRPYCRPVASHGQLPAEWLYKNPFAGSYLRQHGYKGLPAELCSTCETLGTRNAHPTAWPVLQKASGGGMDLLPGICALTQQWLGDVALPGFRGMPATAASLNAWFTNRQVVQQLKVRKVATCRDCAGDAARGTLSAGALSASLQSVVLMGLDDAMSGPLQGGLYMLKCASSGAIRPCGSALKGSGCEGHCHPQPSLVQV